MPPKPKLNRKDFLFQDGWFQTKLKKPTELVMQQFQISDCEQCNILLLDSNACVYIDSCKYCNIFIGPSESSIFIRDCQSINLVSISQQFRVRDSFDCKFAIFCESQPIIESSSDLTFMCYPKEFTYAALQQQMKQAKLSAWNNNWFDIYDFTPKKFSKDNYEFSSYQKEFILLKDIFFQKIRQNKIQQTKKPVIPSIEGNIKLDTLQSYTLDQIIFLVLNPSIDAHQVSSLILQSKYVPLQSQVQEIIKVKIQKGKKLLFLKIRKEDESRWKQSDKVVQIIKTFQEKQLIDSIVFAPFKDQH